MVERDEQVAAVWKAILGEEGTRLAERIVSFSLTPETLAAALAAPAEGLLERAFQTLLRNRVSHGGILAPGSGVLKYGENGKGIRSRWYPETLQKRIRDIQAVKRKIQFIEGDGMRILRESAFRADIAVFIDPPYTAAGKKAGTRLYTYNELDHDELFRIAKTLAGDFLMTYDNAGGVRALAKQHGFDIHPIPMKNTHHAELTELLIGRDLDWARR
jgi:DNA adenine methylase